MAEFRENNEVHADKFVEADEELRRLRADEPWDEVFAGKPDLIASGKTDRATVLLKMSRRHANVLGAYLNGRNDVSMGTLPGPVKEILEALTVRLVYPSGARWADLREVLDGEAATHPIQPHMYEGRRRRAYDGGPNGEDLRENYGVPLLGDADGTPANEWLNKEAPNA